MYESIATDLRRICGHDSWSVDGCLTCEAADRIESDYRTIGRLREIADAFLPVMEAARPLVLNLERLRDAARVQGQ